jgi:Domain of unknown function (DUF4136)
MWLRPGTFALAIVALTGAACAPALTVGADAASNLQPAAYRSYTWEMPDQFPTGDPRLDNNPFFISEVQRQVELQLGKLGLMKAQSGGDLTVHFHATVRDRVNVYEVDRAAGYDQTGYAQSQVVNYEEGTVLIDIADVKGKKVIWRGWMQTDLSGAIGNNQELAKRVRDGMIKLFTKFPAGCISPVG